MILVLYIGIGKEPKLAFLYVWLSYVYILLIRPFPCGLPMLVLDLTDCEYVTV